MKRILIMSLVGSFLIWTTSGYAYEPGTHGQMSDFAAQHSVLAIPFAISNTTVLQDLGLNAYADASQQFPDIQNGETVDLGPDGSDPFQARTPLDVQQLIVTGAQLEDESGVITGRPLNHFFDPISGLPLNYTVLGVYHQSKYDAPQWAAGSHCAGSSQTGPYSPSGDDASDSNQCFSLQDALSYFYSALTAPQAADRNQQFGNLFLTLGHLMHLVQDMAQPQHVRNDLHCDVWPCHLIGKYNPSRYETITYNLSGANIRGFTGHYGPMSFPAAGDFWANGANSGLAQYTNNNFFSAGSLGLYGGAGSTYSKPVANGQVSTETIQQVLSDLGRESNSTIDGECPAAAPCYVTFVATTVHDNYKNIDTANPKAAAVSLFSEDMVNKGDTETFSLNDATYEAAWQFLIPAAIDYSTGLINYVFRGRLDVQPDLNNPGGYIVTNESAYPMSQGTLTVYYDAVDGKRYPVPDASWSDVSVAATGNDPADQYSVQCAAPTNPAPANAGEYMFVFKGEIGSEIGIAAKQIKPKYDVDVLLDNAAYAPGDYGFNTVLDVDDNGNLQNQMFLFVNQFCSGGARISTLDHCQAPVSFAEYNGSVYDLIMQRGINLYDENGEHALIMGYLRSGCGSANLAGIAVNSSNLFVLSSGGYQCLPNGGRYIDEFDHAGNYLSSIALSPSFYIDSYGNSLSANDTSLCVAGYNVAELVNLSTNSVIPLLSGSPSPIGCASTKDRQYIVTEIPELYEYDDSGKLISSLSLTGIIKGIPRYISATPNQIYIYAGGGSTGPWAVYVFDRMLNYNSDGSIASEKLQYSSTMEVAYSPDGAMTGPGISDELQV